MSKRCQLNDPEQKIAAAVVLQTIRDLAEPYYRLRAIDDITCGGVNPWLDIANLPKERLHELMMIHPRDLRVMLMLKVLPEDAYVGMTEENLYGGLH